MPIGQKKILYTIYVKLDDIERAIIKVFKTKYKLVDGNEYFEGLVDDLIHDTDTIISNYIEPEQGICEICTTGVITIGKPGEKIRCIQCFHIGIKPSLVV